MGAFIYAMSDMHGDLAAFEEALALVDLSDPGSLLVLCGDYIDHARIHLGVCERIMELQRERPGQVVALMGNHEAAYLEDEAAGIAPPLKPDMRAWMRELPLYHETEGQIFVHAGVDEAAGDLWRVGTPDYCFYGKFPATFGPFLKDVVAGHVGTYLMCEENRVFWDGDSHYYLDGSTEVSHYVPVLRYDLEARRYSTFERAEGDVLSRRWAEVPVRRR